MPMPCWLKHLCSIRALVPMSFYLSFSPSLFSLSLYFWLIPWGVEAGCVTQGILASLLLSLSYRRLRTTRFQSIKGPTERESKKEGKHVYVQMIHFAVEQKLIGIVINCTPTKIKNKKRKEKDACDGLWSKSGN